MKTFIALYTHNLSSCEIKAYKNFRSERDSNPTMLCYLKILVAWTIRRLIDGLDG